MKKLQWLVLASVAFHMPAAADEHPARQIQFKTKDAVIAPGGSQPFEIAVTVPASHHIYLTHATSRGNAILISFSIPGESGFQLQETRRPAGVVEAEERVLRGSGNFSFILHELAMHKAGDTLTVPLKVRVQICQEGKLGICFMPTTIEKTFKVKVAGQPVRLRSTTNTSVKWVNSYEEAMKQAKAKSMNVYALISSPATCGACQYLESEVLPNAGVTNLLNKGFIPYRVPRGEYSRAGVSGSFGIPFYSIITPSGEIRSKWQGALEPPGFIARLKPFATEPAPAPAPQPTPASTSVDLASGARKCKLELKKNYAYRASQNGDFAGTGDIRVVANSSQAGAFTVLHLARTGEIESSYSAKLQGGALVLENYLRGKNLPLSCSEFGVIGEIKDQGLEINIDFGR